MPIANALWITVIGMGLVFVVIFLLWGMMALLVRVLAEPAASQPEPPAEQQPAAVPEDALLLDRKRRAAAAAVAAALAMAQESRRWPGAAHTERANGVGVWQAANRAWQLGQRSVSFRKKGK